MAYQRQNCTFERRGLTPFTSFHRMFDWFPLQFQTMIMCTSSVGKWFAGHPINPMALKMNHQGHNGEALCFSLKSVYVLVLVTLWSYLGRNFRGQPAVQAAAERCTGAVKWNLGQIVRACQQYSWARKELNRHRSLLEFVGVLDCIWDNS